MISRVRKPPQNAVLRNPRISFEEGICPTCEREIEDESHLDIEDQQSHVDELNDHISELTQKKTELEDELEVVEQRCEDAETLRENKQSLEDSKRAVTEDGRERRTGIEGRVA